MAIIPGFDYLFKILLIGDVKVGKTTFLTKYLKGVVTEPAGPTLGVEYQTKSIILKDGTVVKVQIWDTSGSERYKAITTAHYRKSAGALLFFDLTDRTTFQNAHEWLKEIKNYAEENTAVMLVGNKYDLVENNSGARGVSIDEATKFADKYNLMYAETSAKTGYNTKEAFEGLIEAIYQEHKRFQSKSGQDSNRILKLKTDKQNSLRQEQTQKTGCC